MPQRSTAVWSGSLHTLDGRRRSRSLLTLLPPSAVRRVPRTGNLLKGTKMPRKNLRLSMILLAWSATGFTNGHESVGPVEATIAYEALEAEVRVSEVHPDALKLLLTVLDRATRAAVRVSRAPKSRDEALAVLLTIQHSLESHNFLQPANEADWPITIGDALKPLQIAGAQLERELAFPDNARR